jgi:hypothetical protein
VTRRRPQAVLTADGDIAPRPCSPASAGLRALKGPSMRHTAPCDRRRPLNDLVALGTLEQRKLKPVAGASRARERDLTRGLASGTQ